jgi:hypothetical protein
VKTVDKHVQEVKHHYILIEDLSKFLRKKYNNKQYAHTEHCPNCLNIFWKTNGRRANIAAYEENFRLHKENCFKNKPNMIILPQEGQHILKFHKHLRKNVNPVIGFFDFEAANFSADETCVCANSNLCTHKTVNIANQKAISYCLLFVDLFGTVLKTVQYTGNDAALHFNQTLVEIEDDLIKLLQRHRKLEKLSEGDESKFQESTVCWICEKPLTPEDETNATVRDHCHYSGQFLGAAHSLCNIVRRQKSHIPLFAHNMSKYDSHFVLKNLTEELDIVELGGIATNSEKFRTIRLNNYVFLDSTAFLNASLDKLTQNLIASSHDFPLLDQIETFQHLTLQERELMLRKGVFCYDYCTSIDALSNCHEFPSIDKFFSVLTNSGISEEDYEHGKKVYNMLNCSSMLDYMEKYCLSDTILLAEVVLKFRLQILEQFELDCSNYISLPALAFDAMFRQTNAEIELITDMDQLLFFESNLRGGNSMISERYAESDSQHEINYVDGMDGKYAHS